MESRFLYLLNEEESGGRLTEGKRTGVAPSGKFLAIFLEDSQRQSDIRTGGLMRIGSSDNLPLGADSPAIAVVMMVVAVSTGLVTAGDIGLVLDSAGGQQRLLVQGVRYRSVGNTQRQTIVAQITRPCRKA